MHTQVETTRNIMNLERYMGCRRRELWYISVFMIILALWVFFKSPRSKSNAEHGIIYSDEHREALRKRYYKNYEHPNIQYSVKSFLPDYVIDVDPPDQGGGDADDVQVPQIPHILHQVWDSNNKIPRQAAAWMKTWKLHHPGWQYWLWTPKEARELINKVYPSYLTLYDSYPEDIFRIDVMRLFVLYTFGGVYVDLDMLSLKPMDAWTYNYGCILTHETYEHSFIVNDKNETNVVNGFMACRAKHPFIANTIKMLPEGARHFFGDFLQATGPFFIERAFKRWKAEVDTKQDDSLAVAVLHPKYFLPTFDPSLDGVISAKCSPTRIVELSPVAQALCHEIWHRLFRNNPYNCSYADHKWMHYYMYGPKWKAENAQNISQIIPDFVNTSVMVVNLNEGFTLE